MLDGQLHTLHPLSGVTVIHGGYSVCLLLPIQPQIPAHGIVLPTARVDHPISINLAQERHPRPQGQAHVFLVILDPVS